MDLPNDQLPDNLDAIEMAQNYIGINEAMMNSYEFNPSTYEANSYSLAELTTRIQLLQQQCDANQTLLDTLHKIS
ncbi:MAG: hypothetical protein WCP16_06020 [Pseudanabaena sp. ELA645]|jgi:hypothetical protein